MSPNDGFHERIDPDGQLQPLQPNGIPPNPITARKPRSTKRAPDDPTFLLERFQFVTMWNTVLRSKEAVREYRKALPIMESKKHNYKLLERKGDFIQQPGFRKRKKKKGKKSQTDDKEASKHDQKILKVIARERAREKPRDNGAKPAGNILPPIETTGTFGVCSSETARPNSICSSETAQAGTSYTPETGQVLDLCSSETAQANTVCTSDSGTNNPSCAAIACDTEATRLEHICQKNSPSNLEAKPEYTYQTRSKSREQHSEKEVADEEGSKDINSRPYQDWSSLIDPRLL